MSLYSLTLFLSLFVSSYGSQNLPEQVHLSYAGDPTQMVVTWLTMDKFKNADTVPYVTYGVDDGVLDRKVFGNTTRWTDGGKKQVTRFTHRATLTGLTPGQRYYYSVGSDEGVTETFNFRAIQNNGEVRGAVFGDLSESDAHAAKSLIHYVQNGLVDIVFHIGDIAYDLDSDNGHLGDSFMRFIQPIAAFVPYMIVAGNHDSGQDFLHYIQRFTMPASGIYSDNQFWSGPSAECIRKNRRKNFMFYDIGNVHFIGLSSEYYGSEMYKEADKQFKWFKEDLAKNQDKDWIMYMIHRPMYCSNKKAKHCHAEEFLMTRTGTDKLPGLETTINKGGVDLGFWGHRHTYERFYPLYQGLTYKQADTQHYHNSPTTTYVLTGAAGCNSHEDQSDIIPAPYSAVRSGSYGFSYFHVHNSTTTSVYYVPAESPETPTDVFTLTKDKGFKPGQWL